MRDGGELLLGGGPGVGKCRKLCGQSRGLQLQSLPIIIYIYNINSYPHHHFCPCSPLLSFVYIYYSFGPRSENLIDCKILLRALTRGHFADDQI